MTLAELLQEAGEQSWEHSGQGYSRDPSMVPPDIEQRPGIGPHEGKELTMMRDGVKPAALINRNQLPQWAALIRSNRLHVGQIPQLPNEVVITQPSEGWRIERIARILADVPNPNANEAERRKWEFNRQYLGQLLGYTQQDIGKFMAQFQQQSQPQRAPYQFKPSQQPVQDVQPTSTATRAQVQQRNQQPTQQPAQPPHPLERRGLQPVQTPPLHARAAQAQPVPRREKLARYWGLK